MTKKDIHVVPHKDGWATKTEGAGRVGVVTDTRKQAINRAKEQAVREKVEVVIRGAAALKELVQGPHCAVRVSRGTGDCMPSAV